MADVPGYATSKEVRALARIRLDRTHGEGTFEAIETLVFGSGPKHGLLQLSDSAARNAIEQAERDLKDVAEALGGLRLDDGASDWARAVLSSKERPSSRA